ncbi:MAG: hypothetical protein GVY18_05710 [Bacteroidetes bacterium]|jgi:hypothetical protein|nr:hypothetical protein [Bacteroidota bacterium]
MTTSSRGCARHLAISAILLVLLGAGMVIWNWDTFSMIVSNMASMGDGARIANQIATPDDLLDVLAKHEGASLVAFDTDDPENGIYYRADTLRPVVNLPRLLLLAGYAEAVDRGALDPASAVPLDSVSSLYLAGMGHQGHPTAVDTLRAQRRIVDEHLTLADVVEAMSRWNDAAAADYLLLRLGRAAVDSLPRRLAVPCVDPPVPAVGRYLLWNNHRVSAPPEERLATLEALPRASRTDSMYALARTVREDSAFRRREQDRLHRRGAALTLAQQQRLAAITFPRGTARAYASVLARVAAPDAASLPGDSLFKAYLARSIDTDSLDAPFARIATESGAFPGMLSFAGYAQGDDVSSSRVVVLLIEKLPMAVFYHLLQTGIDRGFQLQLLGDDAFFEEVQSRLGRASADASQRPS